MRWSQALPSAPKTIPLGSDNCTGTHHKIGLVRTQKVETFSGSSENLLDVAEYGVDLGNGQQPAKGRHALSSLRHDCCGIVAIRVCL